MLRQLPRSVVTLLALASFVIIVAGMKGADAILVPFLLAAFIGILILPLFNWLRQKGMPSALALLILVVLLIAVGSVFVGVVTGSIREFNRSLPTYEEGWKEKIADGMAWLHDRGFELPEQGFKQLLSVEKAMSFTGAMVAALGAIVGNAFLVLLVLVFILLEAAILPGKMGPESGVSQETWDRLRPITASIRRYMGLKTAVSMLTGFLVWISLTLLHVDFAALLGILAFVLNFIPNIGSIIASVPAVLLALVQHGIGTALIVLCIYLAVNIGIGSLLEPRLMGHELGLSPLAVIASLIFWGWVFGGAGMLLAVPLTRIAKIILESSDETRWVAMLLSTSRPQASPLTKAPSTET